MRYHVKPPFILSLLLFCVLALPAIGQNDKLQKNADADSAGAASLPYGVFQSIAKRQGGISNAVEKQTQKLLLRMMKKEAKLQKKLQGIDSAKAVELFSGSKDTYRQLQNKLKSPLDKSIANPLKEYIPNLDSVGTAMKYLQKVPGLSPEKLQLITKASDQLQQLQSQMQKANDVSAFIKQRERQLKETLGNMGFAKQLKNLNKEVYYYQQRLAEYKQLLKDRKKLEEKAIATLRELPAFKSFFQKNSYLAQLFRMPGTPADPANPTDGFAGLQTRGQVSQLLQQRTGSNITQPAVDGSSAGGSPEQYIQQQIQVAQSQLGKLKDKLNNSPLGGNGSGTMPDFKPNSQKTKSFLQRLEYGVTLQSNSTTNFLPATEDIVLLAGYKLSDKASVGLGAGYKLGLGRGWNHIALSNQGASFRSYLDIKAKGSVWISGGFEYQYLSAFQSLRQIKQLELWQRSCLLGITKKYRIGKKKEGKMQLLYDFLATQQLPRAEAFKFRLGWSF